MPGVVVKAAAVVFVESTLLLNVAIDKLLPTLCTWTVPQRNHVSRPCSSVKLAVKGGSELIPVAVQGVEVIKLLILDLASNMKLLASLCARTGEVWCGRSGAKCCT